MFILLKEDGSFWEMFPTGEKAIERFAELTNTDVGDDWIEEIGWGYIDNDGNEYGIFMLEDL